MASKTTPSWRRLRWHRVTNLLPWATWLTAAGTALWIAQGLGTTRPLPGEAERREVTLAAPDEATVLEVTVEPGQVVRAGETLALLDTSALDRALTVTMAELERLTANVPALAVTLAVKDRDAINRLKNDLERAVLFTRRREGERARAVAELATLDEQIARHRRLLAQQLSTTRVLEELGQKRARVEQEVAAFPALVAAAIDHESAARARLNQLFREAREVNGASPQGDRRLAPLRSAIAAQEGRVGLLQDRLARMVVRAPVSGVVAAVVKRAGDHAAKGQALLTLLQQRPRRVVAWIDGSRARSVVLGAQAELRPESRDSVVRTGQVVALGPAIERAPARFSVVAGQPLFARAVYIEVDLLRDQASSASPGTSLIPGERFKVLILPQVPSTP